MSTASVTYSFASSTTAVASQVNQNFSDLVSFINSNCIQQDGSLGFSANVANATVPTAVTHLTNKLYVDQRSGIKAVQATGATVAFTAFDTDKTLNTLSLTVPNGKAMTILAWGSYIALGNTQEDSFQARISISFDNGATYDQGQQVYASGSAATGATKCSPAPFHLKAGTSSSATCKVKLTGQQVTTLSSFASAFEPTIIAIAFPTAALQL